VRFCLLSDYRCGGDNYWSEVYTFTTFRAGESWSPRLAVYGDLGTDGQSLQFLRDEIKQGNFDVILHVGWLTKGSGMDLTAR